ncbi:unnamed protein product [Brachionus calyciflorus]|uniref:Tc1-like transposase DDE domain-containing protein n=1 Tax=Brachionus calyciflorus TaxID=104777 RepID=A0A813MB01_9BILA|nr:unnamed protein product [Brachionus calyciflorus]
METMENHLLPSAEIFFDQDQDWIFQQDEASSHTAHSVRNWFQEKQIPSYIDHKMVNTKITSVEHLKSVLFDEWLKFPSDVVKNMIESMPIRVAECIKAKGGHLKSNMI